MIKYFRPEKFIDKENLICRQVDHRTPEQYFPGHGWREEIEITQYFIDPDYEPVEVSREEAEKTIRYLDEHPHNVFYFYESRHNPRNWCITIPMPGEDQEEEKTDEDDGMKYFVFKGCECTLHRKTPDGKIETYYTRLGWRNLDEYGLPINPRYSERRELSRKAAKKFVEFQNMNPSKMYYFFEGENARLFDALFGDEE